MANDLKPPNLDRLSPSAREWLRRVHVNLPWRHWLQYRDLVLEKKIHVELGFSARELDDAPRSELAAAARSLEKAGCRTTLHGPFWDLSPGSSDPLVRGVTRLRLQQFMDLLDVFHPEQVVCHTGFDPRHYREHREEYLDRSLAVWGPLVVQAERAGTPLLLENVWEEDPDFHKDLLDRLASPWTGFCLDVGHQHSFSKTPLALWLEALGGELREVHLHDNDSSHDLHLPVGRGTIDFRFLFGFLENTVTMPVLTLEPHCGEHLFHSLEGLSRVCSPSRVPLVPGTTPWKKGKR